MTPDQLKKIKATAELPTCPAHRVIRVKGRCPVCQKENLRRAAA